jgi:hypothetical protein
LDEPSEAAALYDAIIDPDTTDSTLTIHNITNVSAGDYIFVERNSIEFGHGYLVVGWGQIMSCPSALSTTWGFSSDDAQSLLYPSFASAPSNAAIVPYVVDFPGSVDSPNQTQRPRPRPFYCSYFNDPTTLRHQLVSDGFAFFTLPNTINIQADLIFSSPNSN